MTAGSSPDRRRSSRRAAPSTAVDEAAGGVTSFANRSAAATTSRAATRAPARPVPEPETRSALVAWPLLRRRPLAIRASRIRAIAFAPTPHRRAQQPRGHEARARNWRGLTPPPGRSPSSRRSPTSRARTWYSPVSSRRTTAWPTAAAKSDRARGGTRRRPRSRIPPPAPRGHRPSGLEPRPTPRAVDEGRRSPRVAWLHRPPRLRRSPRTCRMARPSRFETTYQVVPRPQSRAKRHITPRGAGPGQTRYSAACAHRLCALNQRALTSPGEPATRWASSGTRAAAFLRHRKSMAVSVGVPRASGGCLCRTWGTPTAKIVRQRGAKP